MNNNQEKQHGGKREGAGRPKGTGHKPKMTDDLTLEEKKALLVKAFSMAKAGDNKLLQFFLEQIYGKAKQNIGIEGGEEGEPVGVVMFPFKQYDTLETTKETGDSPS